MCAGRSMLCPYECKRQKQRQGARLPHSTPPLAESQCKKAAATSAVVRTLGVARGGCDT